MRVLNFLNVPFSPEQIRSGGAEVSTSGGWMAALLDRLLDVTDLEICAVAFGDDVGTRTAVDGRLTTVVLPQSAAGTARGLAMCRKAVEAWGPDLIHIHGTENCFVGPTGVAGGRVPVLVSIQGLLGPCSEWYRYFGNRTLADIVRMHRVLEIPALRGHWMEYLTLARMARAERATIRENRFFMGRTAWDRAYIRAHNPGARYYHGGELLREPFWNARWDVAAASRHRIIFTNGGHPRKGAEVVFEAARLLRPDYPEVEVVVAGRISQRNGYGRYIRRRMRELGCARELGPLDAVEMARALAGSHVFVSPSFIENSSNACCEAQLLGMPVVCSYTGGMPSLVQEGRTGLFFPTGDAPMLASRIREVFESDDFAQRLGAAAREAARRRHDPETVVSGIVEAYRDIVGRGR